MVIYESYGLYTWDQILNDYCSLVVFGRDHYNAKLGFFHFAGDL